MSKLVNKYGVYLVALLLVMVTFVAYCQVLGHDFVNYDDDVYVTENSHVKAGLTGQSIGWALTATTEATWQPLVWISYMLDYQLYELDPLGYHLTNLLLHLANTLLLFLVLRRMTGFLWRSAFVAALLAIHPLHVESVAWIAERKDVLSTFFWMLVMGAYVLYAERPSLRRYLPVTLLFALGLMAKPMLVTLPVVLLLLDYWPLRRLASERNKAGVRPSAFWRLICEKMPLFALAIGSSIITLVAQRKGEAVSSFELLSLGIRVSNALVSYVSYMGKMFWPRGLAVFYPHPGNALATWQIVGAALLLVCASALVIWLAKRRAYLAVGWLWYVGTLVPTIGIVQTGGHAMADRFTYIPLIGLFIMITWGVPDLLGRRESEPTALRVSRTFVLPMSAGILVAVLAMCTWFQVGHWRNTITLFEHALRVTKDNYPAHSNLGSAYAKQGKYETALFHYTESLRIRADVADLHLNLGNTLFVLGKIDQAIQHYALALRIEPDLEDAHYNLDIALARQKEAREAAAGREKPQVKHSEAATHFDRGVALHDQGRLDEAIREYQEAIRLEPSLAEPHCNLGLALKDQGRIDEAIREYREAIRLKPDFVQAHNNLAIALYSKGMYAEAWREVHLCEKYGLSPHPSFLEALSQKMPDPGE